MPTSEIAEPAERITRPRYRRDLRRAALAFLLALLFVLGAYLVHSVPGAWFPRASVKGWNAGDLVLARGKGRIVGNVLIVTAPDADGNALVTLTTDLRSTDYPAIEWIASGVPQRAEVRLLWRTDLQPEKLQSADIEVATGRLLPVEVSGDPAWIGRVTGVALAIHGPLTEPMRIRGLVAKPMGAVEILQDRLGEWLAFERWSGTSINTMTGGADNQDLPLPLLLALVVGVAGLIVAGIHRWRPQAFDVAMPGLVAGLFLVAWLVLDVRWTWNLARQEQATSARYAGKDLREKLLANDDGRLYAFIEKALAVLPRTPARIIVAADADYFRGRAAYHLYPHSVYFDPRSNALPAADQFHPGEWLLVYQRHGIQFDAALGKLRWNGNQTVSAELKLLEPGAALFLIR